VVLREVPPLGRGGEADKIDAVSSNWDSLRIETEEDSSSDEDVILAMRRLAQEMNEGNLF
jgi:hypothetical protein